MRSAPARFAPVRSAPFRFASERLAPARLAPARFAPERSAPERSAPERSALLRSALLRMVYARFAPARSACGMVALSMLRRESFVPRVSGKSSISMRFLQTSAGLLGHAQAPNGLCPAPACLRRRMSCASLHPMDLAKALIPST